MYLKCNGRNILQGDILTQCLSPNILYFPRSYDFKCSVFGCQGTGLTFNLLMLADVCEGRSCTGNISIPKKVSNLRSDLCQLSMFSRMISGDAIQAVITMLCFDFSLQDHG